MIMLTDYVHIAPCGRTRRGDIGGPVNKVANAMIEAQKQLQKLCNNAHIFLWRKLVSSSLYATQAGKALSKDGP